MSPDRDQLTRDTVYDILSSPRRRYVLYYLRREGGPVKLTDLADELAEWEYETPGEELTKQQRKRMYVSLYQTHVPRLASAGVIDYDSDTGTIRLTDRVYELDQFMPAANGREHRWALVYLTLAAISTVLFIGIMLVQEVVVPLVLVAAIVIILFGVASVVHYYVMTRQRKQIPFELLKDNHE